MSQPYVGEIRLVAMNFAPAGWADCDGRVMPIEDNEVLFQLIGTTYGGNGTTDFALPDLRGRTPVHVGNGPGLTPRSLASTFGAESVTLDQRHVPAHTHPVAAASGPGFSTSPVGTAPAALAQDTGYAAADAPTVAMATSAVGSVGAGAAHDNRQPYLTLRYIISLFGVFPSQS